MSRQVDRGQRSIDQGVALVDDSGDFQPLESEWTVRATGTNAIVTATKAGVMGKSHYVTGIIASYGAAVAFALLELKDGSTTIVDQFISDRDQILFSKPVKITVGADAVTTIPAGGVGVVGTIILLGYTK